LKRLKEQSNERSNSNSEESDFYTQSDLDDEDKSPEQKRRESLKKEMAKTRRFQSRIQIVEDNVEDQQFGLKRKPLLKQLSINRMLNEQTRRMDFEAMSLYDVQRKVKKGIIDEEHVLDFNVERYYQGIVKKRSEKEDM